MGGWSRVIVSQLPNFLPAAAVWELERAFVSTL